MTLQPTPALYFVWFVAILGKALLLAVLIRRKRFTAFPVFFAYAVMLVTKSLILLWYSFHDEHGAYFYAYYPLSILESVLTLAVLFEVFDKVFGRKRIIRAGLMRGFVVAYGFTAVVAVSLSAINIHAYPLRVMALANFAERLAVFVSFAGFAATAFFSVYLKIPWRPHVYGIAAGFLLSLSVNAVFTAVLASQRRATVEVLRYIPMIGFILAEIAWIRYLTPDEPELIPVSPEIVKQLRAFIGRAEVSALD